METQPGFDQILVALRGVVEKLESGKLSLEESLAAFEQGVRLSRQGATLLDAAEKRVDILVKAQDGSDGLQPFAATADPIAKD